MRPILCSGNLLNPKIRPGVALSASATTPATQRPYVYDHRSDRVLITSGATDSNVDFTFSFSEPVSVDVLAMLKTNTATFSINGRLGGSGGALLINESGTLTKSSYYKKLSAPVEIDWIRFRLSTTQIASQEKEIGELYAGTVEIEPDKDAVSYSVQYGDPHEGQIVSNMGYVDVFQQNIVYGAELKYAGLDRAIYSQLADFMRYGGKYVVIPCGADDSLDSHPDITIDQIYYVTKPLGAYTSNPISADANGGIMTVRLQETKP